jgi:hypothetical protein
MYRGNNLNSTQPQCLPKQTDHPSVPPLKARLSSSKSAQPRGIACMRTSSPQPPHTSSAFHNGIEHKLGGGATDEDFFHVSIDWLYSRKIHAGLNQNILLKAVVCGHFITVPDFEAAVHNELIDHLIAIAAQRVPSLADINFVFEGLPMEHALLDLFAELHCYWGAHGAEHL